MPFAPLSVCPVPGCHFRFPCPTHPKEARIARHTPATVRAWYHLARWRNPIYGRRAVVLRRDCWCVICRTALATEVDHIIPHRGNADRFWDPDNLQGLCASCHSHKTQGGA